MRETLQYLEMLARLPPAVRRYLAHTLTLEEAQSIIRERMERRAENFLRIVERSIYGYPASPYLALLKLAGCELGDLQALVRQRGVEGALHALRADGVYVTFEEFKGRKPLVRRGRTLAANAHDFDNPVRAHHFYAETGGSTGAALRIAHDLDHMAAGAPHHAVAQAAHGVLDVPMAVWRGILPDGSGLNNNLRAVRMGRTAQRWFSQVPWRGSPGWLRYDLMTCYFVLLTRLGARARGSAGIPWPQYVPLDRAEIVARWMADALKAHGACLLSVQVSRALRVALAAQQAGLDLTGAVMMIAGEPPTPAKVAAIERSGARCFPTYGLAEAGRVGMGCVHPHGCNDVHLLSDAFALTPFPRQAPGTDLTIDTFSITTLLPTAPKIMLNVAVDDYGVVEERRCGCELEAMGFATHLRDICSYAKLTTEGVTLVGSDMVRVLEEVLPARFGGSPLDYQLQEQEDAQGFTRLYLLVSPRVAIDDEKAVVDALLKALSGASPSANVAQAVWKSAQTIQVRRAEPVWTARGKLPSFQRVNR